MKDRLCLGSLEAFRVAFLLPVERWPPVNKAESVLKEQPLYQATSQHRVSTQRCWMVKGSVTVSTPDTNGKWDCQPVAWCVTRWHWIWWKVLKRKWKRTTNPSLKWSPRIYLRNRKYALWFSPICLGWLRISWNWMSSRHLFLSPPCLHYQLLHLGKM